MDEHDKGDLKGPFLGPLRLLRAAAFLSTFDRFTIAPMLVTIAAALGVSLEEVAAAASLYFLLYGLMQPVWGISLRPTRTGASDAPCAAYRRCARFSFVLDWLTVLVSH